MLPQNKNNAKNISSRDDSETRTILIIDDEQTIIIILEKILKQAGFKILSASNCSKGLELARKHLPDLIFLDVMLPDGNGLDLCRKIKSDPDLDEIQVIMMSGLKMTPEEKARGLDSGADDYMAKPLDTREVLARIEALLRIKRTEEALRASENRYRALFNSMLHGFSLHEPIHDQQGRISDFRYIEVNPSFEELTGFCRKDVIGRGIKDIFPDIDSDILDRYFGVVQSGIFYRFDSYVKQLDRHFEILAYTPEKNHLAVIFWDITSRKKSEQALQIAKQEWEKTFNTMTDPILILDTEYRIIKANNALLNTLGRDQEMVLGEKCYSTVCDCNGPVENCPHQRMLLNKTEVSQEVYIEKLGGYFLMKVTPMFDEQGEIIGSIHVARDINFQKQADLQLRKISNEYEKVFNGTQDALFLVQVEEDNIFRFTRNNLSHQNATGISLNMMRGKTPEQLLGKEMGAEIAANYQRCLAAGRPVSYEETLNLPGGQKTWFTTLTPVFEDGHPIFIVGASHDITKRKVAEEQLRYFATTDELTGLWNRRYFMQAMQQEMERARRYGQTISMLMLDIDHFKSVNDNYGHAAGDKVLEHLAEIMKKNLRQVDIPGRFGGEEFAVILPHTDIKGARKIGERLRKQTQLTPVSYQNKNISITISVGVAEYFKNISDCDELLKIADDALYQAKKNGRNLTVLADRHSAA